jgi:hypothetical protein
MIEKYNYNDEPSGRSETLIQALERCERLEKQLKIAVEDLYVIASNANPDFNRMEYAEKSLKAIKELEK